jgi:rare lipoprotein A (peptidoglycan hydrolase)
MSPASAQRTIALAGVALLAALVAVALASPSSHDSSDPALPRAAGTWYRALAAPYARKTDGRTACGQRITPETLGVAHAVLPCGAKVFIDFDGTRVLTQVIDRGPFAPGREFALTKSLADLIGLHGTQPIRWTFAR